MKLTCYARAGLAVLAVAALLIASSSGSAQRPQADAAAPTAVGKVVAYEVDKSISVEVKQRGGQTKKLDFAIVKDKTKVELLGTTKAIEVGAEVKVWADKDNPKNAARITAGASGDAAAPTATGKVLVYEANKSITVEVKQRGGEAKKLDFAIVKDKTKVELLGATKAIEVGTDVKVWADKDNPKNAARITAGTPQRGGGVPPAPPPPARPKEEVKKQPDPSPAANATPAPVPDKSKDVATTPPAPDKNKGSGKAQAALAVARAIDQEIQRLLDADKLLASPQADDAEFLRRVYLDITGKLPPLDKALAFLDSKDPDKRARLIDELLASPEYGWHFADLWFERINVKDWPVYRDPFIGWMSDSLNQGRGWDQVVQDLVTAEGDFNYVTRGNRLGSKDPQALFILLNTEGGQGKGPNPAWLAAESGRLFLGVQLQCAECHDHPHTPAWKQTDFWGLAGFFSKLKSSTAPGAKGQAFKETPAAADSPVSLTIPQTALTNVGKVVPARLPIWRLPDDPEKLAQEYRPSDQQLLRHSLARWMTAADNPFFAKGAVNWMWAQLFGRGLVNPVDDVRADNPPSHPALLQLLADEFTKSGYDLKYLVRCICLSQAYQRSSVPLPENAQDGGKVAARIVVGSADATDEPTAMGIVLGYEADQSVTVEAKRPGGAKKLRFAIVKGKTSLELAGSKSIEVGAVVNIWAGRDTPKYTHMAVKMMGPGVLYDSLKMATGFPELKVGLPERKTKLTVATQFTPREVFVDFYRSAQGEEADPQENSHGIPQALKLMNAAQLNSVAPVVQRLAGSAEGREQAIEQLYLTTLARRPSPTEAKLIADFLARRQDANPAQGYSAVLWALINSAEFVSNH